jgi:hypothetical protein
MEIWEKKYLDVIESLETKNKKYELRNQEQIKRIEQLQMLRLECEQEIERLQAILSTPQTKPLSDEEIIELYAKVDGGGIIKFAKAIEAKVRGEK